MVNHNIISRPQKKRKFPRNQLANHKYFELNHNNSEFNHKKIEVSYKTLYVTKNILKPTTNSFVKAQTSEGIYRNLRRTTIGSQPRKFSVQPQKIGVTYKMSKLQTFEPQFVVVNHINSQNNVFHKKMYFSRNSLKRFSDQPKTWKVHSIST